MEYPEIDITMELKNERNKDQIDSKYKKKKKKKSEKKKKNFI